MGDPRDIILRRRARFVAASLAAAGIVATPTIGRAEDGGDASAVDASSDADPDAAPPEPCLSIAKPDDPEPQSCLCASAVPDKDAGAAPAAFLAAAALVAARRRRRRD
jgi:MYXO-CTERM domain-containing protein